jgi:hypothetical protein
MQTDQILEQIFSKKKPSLREMIRQAIADLPPQHKQLVRTRFKDIQFCALTLIKHHQFSERDAIAGTIAAIDFSNPDFKLVFKAIAANAPKRYVVDRLPE